MKKMIPILENKIYSRIIFLLASGEGYASEISKKIKKSQATTQKQLTILSDEGFVIIEEHPKKIKNIKLFSINWEKIIDCFYSFYFKEDGRKGFPATQGIYRISDIFNENETKTKIDIKLLKKNKYLSNLIRVTFSKGDYKEDLTINELFEAIPPIFIGNLLQLKEKEILDIKNKIINFEEFKELYNLISMCYSTYYKESVFLRVDNAFNEVMNDAIKE